MVYLGLLAVAADAVERERYRVTAVRVFGSDKHVSTNRSLGCEKDVDSAVARFHHFAVVPFGLQSECPFAKLLHGGHALRLVADEIADLQARGLQATRVADVLNMNEVAVPVHERERAQLHTI